MEDKSEIFGELNNLIKEYKYRYKLSSYDIVDLVLEGKVKSSKFIPIGVLKNRNHGVLEGVVKYLREECKLRFKEISELLNRKLSTIVMSYRRGNGKNPGKFGNLECELTIPTEVFRNRSLSVLENVVVYLKNNFSMKNHDIAAAIGRNDRTVWTVINRVRKKEISSKHL